MARRAHTPLRTSGEDMDAVMRSKRADLDALDPKRFPYLIDSADFFLVCDDEDAYFSNGIDFLVKGTSGVLPA